MNQNRIISRPCLNRWHKIEYERYKHLIWNHSTYCTSSINMSRPYLIFELHFNFYASWYIFISHTLYFRSSILHKIQTWSMVYRVQSTKKISLRWRNVLQCFSYYIIANKKVTKMKCSIVITFSVMKCVISRFNSSLVSDWSVFHNSLLAGSDIYPQLAWCYIQRLQWKNIRYMLFNLDTILCLHFINYFHTWPA